QHNQNSQEKQREQQRAGQDKREQEKCADQEKADGDREQKEKESQERGEQAAGEQTDAEKKLTGVMAQMLKEQEKRDAQVNKRLIQAQVSKKMSGEDGQNC